MQCNLQECLLIVHFRMIWYNYIINDAIFIILFSIELVFHHTTIFDIEIKNRITLIFETAAGVCVSMWIGVCERVCAIEREMCVSVCVFVEGLNIRIIWF